jgi:hypothetical protein
MLRLSRILSRGYTTVVGAALLFIGSARVAAPQTPAEAARTVIVLATTRGITLSQGQVKPGKIRLILDNQTPRADLELELVGMAGNGAERVVNLDKTVNGARSTRVTAEGVVSPGSYKIRLKQIPGMQAEVKVVP